MKKTQDLYNEELELPKIEWNQLPKRETSYFGKIREKLSIKKYKEDLDYYIDTTRKDIETKKKIMEDYLRQKTEADIKFNNIKEPKNTLNLYLMSKQLPETDIKTKIKSKIPFFKATDGYIFYLTKGNDIKIYEVQNLKYLYKNNKEAYALHNKIGTYRNKPAFIIKYPYPITLDINLNEETNTENKLFWDAKAFYNYETMVTKANITNFGNDGSVFDFLKKNWIIVVIVLVLIFIVATPQGKELYQQLLQSMKAK